MKSKMIINTLSLMAAATFARHCAFIHGVSSSSHLADFKPGTVTTTPHALDERWWGTKENLSDKFGCTSFSYAHMNTTGQEDVDSLSSIACDAINNPQPESPETLIFTHSFGNWILANAFNKGMCTKPNNSVWVSIAAPWNGCHLLYISDVVSLPHFCTNHTLPMPGLANFVARNSFWDMDIGNVVGKDAKLTKFLRPHNLLLKGSKLKSIQEKIDVSVRMTKDEAVSKRSNRLPEDIAIEKIALPGGHCDAFLPDNIDFISDAVKKLLRLHEE